MRLQNVRIISAEGFQREVRHMNAILFPMKVHAVKLEYRRLALEKMPHGYFSDWRGKKTVFITYDPEMPKANTRRARRLSLFSKRGKLYSEKINEYLHLKAEYDSLLTSWKAMYSFAPPRVKFPIKQFSDPHKMNNEFFEQAADRCGSYVPDNPTVSDHGDLKSKNELMGADLLKLMDIPFKYETEVYLPAVDETINPDYLVNFYEIDRCAYLEILGMNDKVDYTLRTATKVTGFSKELYRPGREVIYVHVYDRKNFDRDYFVSQVLSAFNDMIPDSALDWEPVSQVV